MDEKVPGLVEEEVRAMMREPHVKAIGGRGHLVVGDGAFRSDQVTGLSWSEQYGCVVVLMVGGRLVHTCLRNKEAFLAYLAPKPPRVKRSPT